MVLIVVADILFIIALLLVFRDNNVHLDGGAVTLWVIALAMRVIGDYRERKKFVDVLTKYVAEVTTEAIKSSGYAHAVYDVLKATKESNQRLEERFAQTESEIESIRVFDSKLNRKLGEFE